jgi:hypothetical protein
MQTQASQDAIAECQKRVRPCGSGKDYDYNECKRVTEQMAQCDGDTDPGEVCRLEISHITPTQMAVGVHAARCKSEKLKTRKQESKFKKGLTRYLLKPDHLVPTVLGPNPDDKNGHHYYITDHHHLSYALYLLATQQGESIDDYHVYACIIGDRQNDSDDHFWDYMVRHHYAWLDNNKGVAIDIDILQSVKGLADLKDYPFRTWSRWVRDSCGYLKFGNDCLGKKPSKKDLEQAKVEDPPPFFLEFKWADYLEKNLKGGDVIDGMDDHAISAKVTQAIGIARGDQAFLEDLPGYNNPDLDVFPVRQVEIAKGCEAD